MKLLIAEDDLTTRTMLTAITRKWGYEPVAVEDGEAAWEIMQQDAPPQLLLLDWEMPRLDGLSLCRRIRQQKSATPPFIVLLTIHSDTSDIVVGLEAGANEYIAKPFDNAELKARLQAGRRMVDLQANLQQAVSRLRITASVFTHASEGIAITDVSGNIIDVNDAFSHITGYSHDEALGNNPRFLQSGQHGAEFYAAMWRDLAEKGRWSGEIWNRRKNGEIYAEMLTISTVPDEQGRAQYYVALFFDITVQKEQQKRLEHIAHYDALTNLPNRVLLADRLHQAMVQVQRREQQLAVLYLDLDGFKVINDTHGHDVGDQLLVALAASMKQVLRDGDTVARLGGDEFVAVLIDLVNLEEIVPIFTRMLAAASQPLQVGGLLLQVSASVGITFYPQTEEVDADQLMRQADQAMYQAKLAGKNRYHIFDAEQDRNVRGHHESLEHIRRALAEDEFVLHYQPKVNMRTGQVIGAEALIRWQHPERGLLSPMVFLPVIEDDPLAVELDDWVINAALAQLDIWQKAGLTTSVSVNIGALQLQQADFVERLRTLLAAYPSLRPDAFELEVLENSALEDIDHISQVMRACGEMGVNFALDDFGTGYSSLTYLKRLPASQLKIDQSFVRDMLEDPEDLAIVDGVLGLSTAFRRQVIAEGVESVEHGKMLLRLGCELAQGYGIARPMPAADFPGWADSWRTDPVWAAQHAVSHDDQPLLFASVEHRAWIRATERFLEGKRLMPPEHDQNLCRFGQWLEGNGQTRHGTEAAFQAIKPLHQRVHTLAAELLELQAQGQTPEVLARLGELYALRDSLLEQLDGLLLGSTNL